MGGQDWLGARFEEHRPHLRAVAWRMLGSRPEAEDAVQEAWLRLSRTDAGAVDNLGGWLTTVVARVCLNVLRSRKARREESLDAQPARTDVAAVDPERAAVLADSVGLALLVVLETLTPAERVAFVLHDLFDLPFDEIARVVDRSPEATRQLASRARRRVRGGTPPESDPSRRREIVEAFLAASRNGDFEALLAVLDPDVVLRADAAAVLAGAQGLVRGAKAVADTFAGRARGPRPALIDGVVGAMWAPGGRPRVVLGFSIAGGRITGIEILMDAARLGTMEVEMLES